MDKKEKIIKKIEDKMEKNNINYNNNSNKIAKQK